MRKVKLHSDTKSEMRLLWGVFEVAVLSIIYYLFWRNGYKNEPFPAYLGNGKYLLMAIYASISWLFIKSSEGFQFGNLRKLDLGISQWLALFITNTITYFQLCLIANRIINPLPMILLFIVNAFVSIVFITIFNTIYRRLYAPHNMIMIYGSDSAVSMKFKLDQKRDRYKVCKLISADAGIDKIFEEIDETKSVIINDVPAQLRNDILKHCYDEKIRAYIVPKISDILIRGAIDISAVDTPMLLVNGNGLTISQRFFKRTVDLVFSLLAVILTSPIILIVAIAIKLEDGGPVFYKQKRATLGGREFDILKFRSMIVDAEKDGRSIPAKGKDPRITHVGSFIRPTRIDELPQLLNILRGDMSIVGPRPERLEHVEKYSKTIPEFSYRLKLKGGLTGYAQIYGKYNTSAYDKLRLDLMYIENYSLLLDIKLILLTFRVLFSKGSTEGFDQIEKNEKRQEIFLQQIREEAENGQVIDVD